MNLRPGRWDYPKLRRLLRPANRYGLDRWVAGIARTLDGLVINVGAGGDARQFGRRVVTLDRYAPGAHVRADLADGLPFAADVFDGAICTEVLEHVPDPSLLLRELHRVIRPGGTAVLSIPFVFKYHADPIDAIRLTPPGLRRELERAGFSVVFTAGIGARPVALLLFAESLHPIAKVVVRAAQLPLAPLLRWRSPRDGHWSEWAANAVAVARKPSHARR